MIVLGIDPGTAIVGYGILQDIEGEPSLITYGAVTTPAKTAISERLLTIYNEIKALITTYHPDAMAVEQLFFGRNVNTALAVGHARGVALLVAAQSGVPVAEYKPAQVKQAISGYGNADKKQVQELVRMQLNLDHIPKPDDAADALAIAICHIHSAQFAAMIAAAE